MMVIQKDGLYLMAYRDMGLRQYDEGGKLRVIPTGIYSANIRDAMPADNPELARTLGAKIVNVVTAREVMAR